jgi:hypothetical protein
MGCTSCTSKGGCESRKGEERQLLSHVLPLLYPGRKWGEPDDEARFPRWRRREGRAAARPPGLRGAPRAHLLPPRRRGRACDYLYALCVGRPPGLVELRDRPELEVPDGDTIEERYLRASLSSMTRVAAVQEVVFELAREGDVYVVRERPRDGVYDPILLKRTQALIELLVASDVTYLDFGLLTKPVSRYAEGFDDAGYEERFGGPPATVNYLFYPQPATAITTSWIPCAR